MASRWELLHLVSVAALTYTIAEFSLVLPLMPQQPRGIAWLFSLKKLGLIANQAQWPKDKSIINAKYL